MARRKTAAPIALVTLPVKIDSGLNYATPGAISIFTDGALICNCSVAKRKGYCGHLITIVSGKPDAADIDYATDDYAQVDRIKLPLFRNWFRDNDWAYAGLIITRDKDTYTLKANCPTEGEFDPVIDIWIGNYVLPLDVVRKMAVTWAASVLETTDNPDALQCKHTEHGTFLSKGLGDNPLDERVQRDFWTVLHSDVCWTCAQRERLLIPDDAPF